MKPLWINILIVATIATVIGGAGVGTGVYLAVRGK